ncbi:hypothetical protein HNP48_002123 [Acidovorax soli]|uniref:Uracil DNA glycosylase superfamily protein n=1 Tax=Acidovorax soli TaxID=592050 RepID=A0A7X0U8S9_9BURK|nr:hypothetical protein [Acidovorax soli]MBB6559456.1 hypothetical protein [Acidovorax soli]
MRYLENIDAKRLQVVIVGKDPFPADATNIPFCKPTWEQQLASNCSGKYVLRSLGVDLVAAQKTYSTPSGLFEILGLDGIVFLNASYDLIGAKIIKSKHLKYLLEAHKINKAFIQRARTVVYCGEACKVKWVDAVNSGLCVVHPDIRNRANPRTFQRWAATWGDNALRDKLGIVNHSNSLPSTTKLEG